MSFTANHIICSVPDEGTASDVRPFLLITSHHLIHRSIEAFERKLEETQKGLNIPSRDFVPILYQEEADYAALLLSTLPILVLGGTQFCNAASLFIIPLYTSVSVLTLLRVDVHLHNALPMTILLN